MAWNRFKVCAHCMERMASSRAGLNIGEGYNIVTNSVAENKIYYYDENGLCTQETDALGNSIFYEYTDDMELYRDIDEEGNLTGYLYDDRGNMTAMQRPDGAVIGFYTMIQERLRMTTDAEDNPNIYVYKDNHLKTVIKADRSY